MFRTRKGLDRLLLSQFVAEGTTKARQVIARDGERGIQFVLEQDRHRLIVAGELIDALEALDLRDNRGRRAADLIPRDERLHRFGANRKRVVIRRQKGLHCGRDSGKAGLW